MERNEEFLNEVSGGIQGTITADANLKYDSYGSGRPDGKGTKTLGAGTTVEVDRVLDTGKPGQTHGIHVKGMGWIKKDQIKLG